MIFLSARGKLKPSRSCRDTGRTNSWILQVHIRNFTLFQRLLLLFFKFRGKSKLTSRCTAPIYVLSMCKRKNKWAVTEIQAVQAHEYKKFYIISKISHFVNFRENSKLTSRYTAPIYIFFHVQEKNWICWGLRRYRLYKLMLKSVDTRTDGQN